MNLLEAEEQASRSAERLKVQKLGDQDLQDAADMVLIWKLRQQRGLLKSLQVSKPHSKAAYSHDQHPWSARVLPTGVARRLM